MKECSTCRIKKAVRSFNRRKASKDGLQNVCKDCKKNKQSRYNPKINARRSGIYWLPDVEVQMLRDFQKNQCWLCQKKEGWKVLHRDHNHLTGWLRGMLCSNCNRRLPSRQCDGSIMIARKYLEGQRCFSEKYIDDCILYLKNPPYFQLLDTLGVKRPIGNARQFLPKYKKRTEMSVNEVFDKTLTSYRSMVTMIG